MNAPDKIRSYLFTSGLDALADHVPVIEKAIHDFIAQLGTKMDVSNDALYRYEVPLISEDGSCSLIDELDPAPYDLARILGGENEANTRKLKLLNIMVTRATMGLDLDRFYGDIPFWQSTLFFHQYKKPICLCPLRGDS